MLRPIQQRCDGCVGRWRARSGQSSVRVLATSVAADDLKVQLVRAVANTDRGRKTTAQQRQLILQLVQQLEETNPTVYDMVGHTHCNKA